LSKSVGAPEPHDFAVRCSIIRLCKKLHLTLPRPSHPAPNVRDDREPPLFSSAGQAKEATDLGVRSIAVDRDRLARRANYAGEACTFASHRRPSLANLKRESSESQEKDNPRAKSFGVLTCITGESLGCCKALGAAKPCFNVTLVLARSRAFHRPGVAKVGDDQAAARRDRTQTSLHS